MKHNCHCIDSLPLPSQPLEFHTPHEHQIISVVSSAEQTPVLPRRMQQNRLQQRLNLSVNTSEKGEEGEEEKENQVRSESRLSHKKRDCIDSTEWGDFQVRLKHFLCWRASHP